MVESDSPDGSREPARTGMTTAPKRSFIKRLAHRYHRKRADNAIVHAALQREYYASHELYDALYSAAGNVLAAAAADLKKAQRSYMKDEISSAELNRYRIGVKLAIRDLHNLGDDHRMRITEWMQDFAIPQFSNNIQSLVYGGAGVLVMIVGLRGLGDLRPLGFLPGFVLDSDGMLQSRIVFVGLCLELVMLLLLAVFFYFTPDNGRTPAKKTEQPAAPGPAGPEAKPVALQGLTKEALDALVERKVEEIRMIERIQKML